MTEAARPPADLDARYQPFGSFAQWRVPAVDLRLVDEAAGDLDRESRNTDQATIRAALDFAVRAAAFDTGAIEGLYETNRRITFAVAAQSAAWESAVVEASGQAAVRHFEAQLQAFDLVLDAATGRTPITAAWLRALHDTTCAGQPTYRALTTVGWQDLPLPRGEFKRMPNHVRQPDGTWHPYAPVDLVAPEVQRLVDEIGSAEFIAAHPVIQAAYVHYALVNVHPFADGNGRVARAAASVFLYRAVRVPLLVFADQRLRYLAALRPADRGDPASFVRFVRGVVLDTIELVIQAIRTARTAGAVAGLAELGGPGDAEAGPDQLRFAASRLQVAVRDELHEVASELPEGSLRIRFMWPPGGEPDRPAPVGMVASGAHHPTAVAATTIAISPGPDRDWPLQATAKGPHLEATVAPMRVRFDNLYPALTAVTRQRVREWARQVANALAAEVLGGLTGPGAGRQQASS